MSFNSPAFYHEVGQLLAIRRRERGLTQEQVARALGIPRATYASLEGGRQRILVDTLWRAAVVLDCPLTTLVPELLSDANGAITVCNEPQMFASNGTTAVIVAMNAATPTDQVSCASTALSWVPLGS